MHVESDAPTIVVRAYRFIFSDIESDKPRTKAEGWLIELFGPAIDSGLGGYRVVDTFDQSVGSDRSYVLNVIAWADDEGLLP